MQAPPENKVIKTLAGELTDQKSPDFGTDCLNLKETVAEKVVSFLRRTAQVHAGRNRAPADPRRVRHLYDIHAISQKYPDVLRHPPSTEFQAIVESDAQQFRSQFPEFAEDLIAHMQSVLDNLSTAKIFEEDYQSFVEDLVYGPPSDFQDVCSTFQTVAGKLLKNIQVH